MKTMILFPVPIRRVLWSMVLPLLLIAQDLRGDSGADHQASQARPISLGTSGGNVNDRTSIYCCSGTLGALVQDENGEYVLSNNHVMGLANQALSGDPVNQPGMIDQNCSSAGAVADFTRLVQIQFSKGRRLKLNHVDAAIAQVRPGMVRMDGNIIDIGGVSGETMAAFIGQSVQKSGRTTGHTFGTVTAVDVTVDVGYSKECGGQANQVARFVNQISISDGSFSAGGDSGSLIVETTAGGNDGLPRAVGLLFAGSDSATLANPIGEVLTGLNVSMVPGVTPEPPATGSIAGNVTDAADLTLPLAGASVSTSSGQSTTTDATGAYILNNVPEGDRTVTASASGYASLSQVVAVQEDVISTADFALEELTLPTLSIAECVVYNTSGGKNQDRNLLMTVRVVDDFGNPLAGASVDIAVTLNGAAFGSGSGATTGSNGEVTYNARNAPDGDYVITVTSVSAGGLTFEGSTPLNSFTKGSDAVPASFCLASASGAVEGQDVIAAGLAFNQARLAKRKSSAKLFAVPGVVGHGLTFVDGQPVVEVYLAKDGPDARRQIRNAVENTPVRIKVTGPFVAY